MDTSRGNTAFVGMAVFTMTPLEVDELELELDMVEVEVEVEPNVGAGIETPVGSQAMYSSGQNIGSSTSKSPSSGIG